MTMDDRSHDTMSGRSLPSIHAITQRLLPCSRAGCATYASDHAELLRHERSCQGSPEFGDKQPSFAGQQMNQFPSQPYRLQTQFEGPSSASSVDGDSDGSPVVMSPDHSRAPSLCPYPPSRRQPGVIRTEKGRGRKSVLTSLDGSIEQHDEIAKRTKKMNKEKANRGDQGAVMQRMEDFFNCYTGWAKDEQSGGNGNGAGLRANKITLLRAQEGMLYYFLHKELLRAIQEDREQEWREEMCLVLDTVTQPDRNPFASTFLDHEPVECYHKEKGKSCQIHGHPDWRECRLAHRQNRFEEKAGLVRRAWQKTKAGAKRAVNAFSCRQ
ncbi:hypothetical protein DOTSEDRAFT_72038 [Dothistroma septosporum NZE10]|uniref:Uncharacterized protein n=1 Tax=Dothistroma septosporum (strain NZE10 / CBS 128990) TaxID=675120 RepID=N1PLN6_DOTSN|nr:hypothetical protein DOTSEDRAFT_72038 [Dothistroma septosporum NZE10]